MKFILIGQNNNTGDLESLKMNCNFNESYRNSTKSLCQVKYYRALL